MRQAGNSRKPPGLRAVAGKLRAMRAAHRGGRKRRNAGRRAVYRSLAMYVLRVFWAIGWRIGLVGFLILSVAVGYYFVSLPPSSELLDGRSRGAVTLFDRRGRPFALRGNHFGGPISIGEVSPYLRNAVIASEDRRFYRHWGISPRGIARAMLINLREGRGPLRGHGGSTITQQLGKLMCLGREFDSASDASAVLFERECRQSTLWRKIKEIPFALALELKYTKDEILTIYLNRVYLGAGSMGFEAASQRYFGKSVTDVTIAEAAMLAGLLTAPSVNAPTRNIARARARANFIINLMESQGFLSVSESHEAREYPAELSANAMERAGGAFADWVLNSAPAYLTTNTRRDIVVRTTFDPDIQQVVDGAIADVFATKVRPASRAEVAAVVMTADGAVLAMTGGRDASASGQFNRATQALRQTGSAFKPFVYAAAIEQGLSIDDRVRDEPVVMDLGGDDLWQPRNYRDRYAGETSVAEAFAQSSNVVAVKLSESIGRSRVRDAARQFGIRHALDDGPALALGTSESTLLEMTGAYAGILNGGVQAQPYGLISLRLEDGHEPLLAKPVGASPRAVSARTAGQLILLMREVIEAGTGQRAFVPDLDLAGKTGTSQNARDAWFIGFSSEYVVGVWMGYDDNTALTGVTGGGLPADIWREIMVGIYENRLPPPLPAGFSESAATAFPPAPARSAGVRDSCELRMAGPAEKGAFCQANPIPGRRPCCRLPAEGCPATRLRLLCEDDLGQFAESVGASFRRRPRLP